MKPFSNNRAATVGALGETALLHAIRGWAGRASPPPPQGIGDDCAVLQFKPGKILAKTDGVVLGRHFTETTSPGLAGAKLLKRNLSDIAAMGGTPRHALVHLLLAPNTATAWLKQFYRGLAKACLHYGVTLAGGGIAQGPDGVFAADLLLLGEACTRVLPRTGAKVGDVIYVTGDLGGSILGKHLHFVPRLAEGRWLASQPVARAMIDVSDGLAKDLPAILPPGTDAQIDPALLPISKAAAKLAKRDRKSAAFHALTDGEDYELLLAVNGRADQAAFAHLWRKKFRTPLTRLGLVIKAADRHHPGQLRTVDGGKLLPPSAHGYEHLRG